MSPRLSLAAAALAILPAACGAGTTETCYGGPCTESTMSSASSANGTGGSGTGGTGGAGGAAACAPTPQDGEFPCDVFAIVHARCNPCHTDPMQNGAPFPLLTYADTQKPYVPGKLIFQQMYDQIGPDGDPRMPLGGMLAEAEYDKLRGWLASCAPPAPAGMGCGCPGNGCN